MKGAIATNPKRDGGSAGDESSNVTRTPTRAGGSPPTSRHYSPSSAPVGDAATHTWRNRLAHLVLVGLDFTSMKNDCRVSL